MILLDTHVWVWRLSDRRRLSQRAADAIEEAVSRKVAFVSSMSLWEVAMLVKKGRLELSIPVEEWLRKARSVTGFHFVPVDNRIAVESVGLEMVQQDPMDRILVATALEIPASLVTRDSELQRLGIVKTIW